MTKATQRARLLSLALAMAGVVLSSLLFTIAQKSAFRQAVRIAELRVDWRAHDVERRLAQTADSGRPIATYLAAQGEITAEQFKHIADVVHGPADLESAFYWAPWITRNDAAAMIRSPHEGGANAPDIAAPRQASGPSHALPAIYEVVFDNTPSLLGRDLLEFKDLHQAVDAARDNGKPQLVAFAGIPSVAGATPSFTVLWPVYGTGSVPASPEARRMAFRGVVTGLFRFSNVLPAVIQDSPHIRESIDVAQGTEETQLRHLGRFHYPSNTFTFASTPEPAVAGAIALERSFTIFGSFWSLDFHFSPDTIADWTSSQPWVWLICGLLITAAVTVYSWQQAGRMSDTAAIARETNDLFRQLFDQNPIGMVLATADTFRFVLVNAAFARMLEYTPEEMQDRYRDEFAVPASHNMPEAVDIGKPNGGWHPVDKIYVTRSGRNVTTRVRVIRLPVVTGREPLVLGLAEDVTGQRALEAELRHAQKMEAIGQLTGGMAHDFNNLLAIIIGNLDLVAPMLDPATEAPGLVEDALNTALRGADLTRQLLAFARRQPLNPARVNLNGHIENLAKLLKRTLGENVRITLDLAPDLWPVIVDPAQLETCLINLATNARDAMPGGGTLTVSTSNRVLEPSYCANQPGLQPGPYAMVAVTDTGTGMAPDILGQVFEPFFTTKVSGKGTGLGLSMVFGFLKQSHGHVSAYSEPGLGTTFRLYLPRADAGVSDPTPLPSVEIMRGHREIVLVVEDNAQLRGVAMRQVAGLGYQVIEAESGEAALSVLQSQSVDLVFSDVVLAGEMDGVALARRIAADWPSVKVLLTSGYAGDRISRTVNDARNPPRLLTKPYRFEELARAIRTTLDAPAEGLEG